LSSACLALLGWARSGSMLLALAVKVVHIKIGTYNVVKLSAHPTPRGASLSHRARAA